MIGKNVSIKEARVENNIKNEFVKIGINTK